MEKKVRAGDRIIFQKNDKNVEVKNGEIGRIKEIDKNGNAIVGIGDEKKPKEYREVSLNLNGTGDRGYTYCDHAYCITSHKSQGATVDKVIVNSESSADRSNFNEFYVQATRQKFDISIYTDSKERLKEQVKQEQNKASTLDTYGEARVDFSKYERAMAENRKPIILSKDEIDSP